MINLFVAVSILIIQLLIISMFYKHYKTIAHPTVFIQVYFTVQIILSLTVFREYDFSFHGILWILFAMFLFSLGGLLADGFIKNKAKKISSDNLPSIKTKLSRRILIGSIILGCLYSIEFFLQRGLSISTLFNLDTLLKLNNEIATQRYTGNGGYISNISRVFLIFIYFSPLISGFNFNFSKNKNSKLLCMLGIMPSFLVVLTQNTKATFIAAVFLFASGYIASSIKLNKRLPKISFKRSLLILAGMLSFLIMLYASMMMRVGRFDVNLINIINRKFTLYALGHIPAFDIWFANHATTIEYHFGTRTFYGVADFLGISERMQGIYVDRAYWSTWSTNVFTIFRSFIEDFGPYLGLGIMLFFGLFMSFVFYKAKANKSTYKGMALLGSFYFYILYGFITSAWSYMSYTLTFILFAIYVQLVSSKSYRYSSSEKEVHRCA